MGDGRELRPRARDLGLYLGELAPGPHNALTDVEGVAVGHATIIEGAAGPLVVGEGPVRTGVTAIVPHGGNVFADKPSAAVHVVNGFGKAVGFVQVAECGVLETPVLLTNTLSVGRVADALIEYVLERNPAIGVTTGTVNAVVGECNDAYLNDIRGRHVGREHVFAALDGARGGALAEGAVGAGTGMTAFGWKGGIGTSSRRIPAGGREYVLGSLVLSNFGAARDLVVGGWPVGRFVPRPHGADGRAENGLARNGAAEVTGATDNEAGDGSVVIIIATDAPLDARQLKRIAARATVGIVRCGSRLSHGSGDYVIAFSTTRRVPHTFAPTTENRVPMTTQMWPDDGPVMADLLRAAGEATEEAVLNSMLQATTTGGRDGHVRYALPVDELRELLRRFQLDH